jgi:hypothetical protein
VAQTLLRQQQRWNRRRVVDIDLGLIDRLISFVLDLKACTIRYRRRLMARNPEARRSIRRNRGIRGERPAKQPSMQARVRIRNYKHGHQVMAVQSDNRPKRSQLSSSILALGQNPTPLVACTPRRLARNPSPCPTRKVSVRRTKRVLDRRLCFQSSLHPAGAESGPSGQTDSAKPQ